MIAGILFFGKDLCSIGMDEADIDEAIDKRIDLLDNGFGFLLAFNYLRLRFLFLSLLL